MSPRSWRRYPRKKRAELFRLQCGICPYCGQRMTFGRNEIAKLNYATMDHVTPRSHETLPPSQQVRVMCCQECNRKKADLPLITFMLRLHSNNSMAIAEGAPA